MRLLIIIILVLIFFPSTIFAAQTDVLYQINQKVCDRFEGDLTKLAAIMEEIRRRKGITETRVAFGGVDTPIKSADYWVTYSAEALAFERAQKYSSPANLRSGLEGLRGKILRTKTEVQKALNDVQK